MISYTTRDTRCAVAGRQIRWPNTNKVSYPSHWWQRTRSLTMLTIQWIWPLHHGYGDVDLLSSSRVYRVSSNQRRKSVVIFVDIFVDNVVQDRQFSHRHRTQIISFSRSWPPMSTHRSPSRSGWRFAIGYRNSHSKIRFFPKKSHWLLYLHYYFHDHFHSINTGTIP